MSRECRALAIAVLLGLTACDRFAHPRYDAPGVDGAARGGGAVASSSDTEGGSDITSPGCHGDGLSSSRGLAAGAPCTTANDCSPTCCSCGVTEWMAASCVAGVCADGVTAGARTGSCGGSGMPVAPGGSTCGGGGFADPQCDACMSASCCLEEAACASDPSCGASESCMGACADAACLSACEAEYGSSGAAADLDTCLGSFCGAACQ